MYKTLNYCLVSTVFFLHVRELCPTSLQLLQCLLPPLPAPVLDLPSRVSPSSCASTSCSATNSSASAFDRSPPFCIRFLLRCLRSDAALRRVWRHTEGNNLAFLAKILERKRLVALVAVNNK